MGVLEQFLLAIPVFAILGAMLSAGWFLEQIVFYGKYEPEGILDWIKFILLWGALIGIAYLLIKGYGLLVDW